MKKKTSNLKKIKAVTDADIPLEVVSKSVLDRLQDQNPTYVSARQLKSSDGVLISLDFARCQGIALFGEGIGALAHNFSTHDPDNFLTGKWANPAEGVEDPREIFKGSSGVVAVHVYHKSRYEWPKSWIESALKKVGIEEVVHIPIKPKEKGVYWRHVSQDVRDGSLCVFPTDFNYGIKFGLNGGNHG